MNIPFYKVLNAIALPKGMLESITRGYRSLFESDAQKHDIRIKDVGVRHNKQGGVYVVDIRDKAYNGDDVNINAMPYGTLKEMMSREGVDANGARNIIYNNFYKQLLSNSNGTKAYKIFSHDDTTLKRLVEKEFKRLRGADITSSGDKSAQQENGASKAASANAQKETPAKEEKTSNQSADCKLPSLDDLDETAGTEDLHGVNSVSLDDTKTMYEISTPMGPLHVRFLNYTFPALKKHAMANNMEITDILYKKYLAVLKAMMKSMSDERAKAVWAWMKNQDDTINSLAKIELKRIKNRWNIWRQQVQEAKEKCADPAAGPKTTEVGNANSSKTTADASKQPETPKQQAASKSDTSCATFDPNNVPGDTHKYNPKFGYNGKTFHVVSEGVDQDVGWGHKGCRTMEALVERYTQRIKAAVPNIPEGDAKRCAIIVAQKLAKALGISCDGNGKASAVRSAKASKPKDNKQQANNQSAQPTPEDTTTTDNRIIKSGFDPKSYPNLKDLFDDGPGLSYNAAFFSGREERVNEGRVYHDGKVYFPKPDKQYDAVPDGEFKKLAKTGGYSNGLKNEQAFKLDAYIMKHGFKKAEAVLAAKESIGTQRINRLLKDITPTTPLKKLQKKLQLLVQTSNDNKSRTQTPDEAKKMINEANAVRDDQSKLYNALVKIRDLVNTVSPTSDKPDEKPKTDQPAEKANTGKAPTNK